MANSFSADLIADVIVEQGMTQLQNHVPNFNLFSTDFSDETVSIQRGQGAISTIQVPLATSAATTLVNPTNKAGGDTTVISKPVTPAHYVQPMHLTQQQLNQGHRLSRVVNISLSALLNRLWTAVSTNITTGNYGSPILDETPSTVDTDDLRTIFAAIEKFGVKNLVVDATFFAQFAVGDNKDSYDIGMSGAYGFSGWDYASDWSAASANVNGFACSPDAIVMAARRAEYAEPLNNVVDFATADLPNGMTIDVLQWASGDTGQVNTTLETVFGAAPGDTTAGKIIENGTA
ncbi:MAG: hypothetical protein AAF546_00200 [Verrucomicrobiota bacterium]